MDKYHFEVATVKASVLIIWLVETTNTIPVFHFFTLDINYRKESLAVSWYLM